MKHLTFDPKSFLKTTKRTDTQDCDTQSKVNARAWYDRKYIGYEIAELSEAKDTNEKTPISFKILDRQFTIHSDLYDIADEIKDSRNILDLKDGWDHSTGKAVSPELYFKSIDFLLMYTNYIHKIYNIVINAPEINLIPSGSIDLSWRTQGARMLINLKYKDNEFLATFYGYHKTNMLPHEGFIDILKVDESMAVWMKQLK